MLLPLLSVFLSLLARAMSIIANTLRSVARSIDSSTTSRAPVNTDGALLKTHAAETKVTQMYELISKPAFRLSDLSAYWDAIEHAQSIGIDDRKMLLERVLVAMSNLKDHPSSLRIQQLVINLLYKDLPHPPNGFLCPLEISRITHPAYQDDGGSDASSVARHPKMPPRRHYAYRAADGSNYNPLIPGLGKAGSPYARSVPALGLTPVTTLPDPNLIFDTLLKRDKFVPHPDGISSLFFAFANLVIHSIFNTNHQDWRINDTSSYLDLSILYGNSEKQLDAIRRNDGTGRLFDDCFADSRLLLMPPASCALLVLLSRNHNYIAQKLLAINESLTFKKDLSVLTPEEKQQQDDEIFHRTRLVNCGYFMHIILGDYVGAILGLARDGSDWRLDPLMPMREMDHDLTQRGEGNVVSIEFNMLYRWHATISEANEKWLEEKFAGMFPKEVHAAQVADFKKQAGALRSGLSKDPREWTFGGLKRVDGQFKDTDLADIIQKATCDMAGAFKARGIPECMRVIEVMSIMQARKWGTCSLNEFRKFIGLKPYSTFKEWNPDPEIHQAAANLYKNIDNLELHVGLQAEETKVPQRGAGLCPGYTISRAILADAVCLTRGDRFLTTDFTPFNLTAWGYQDCQYDKEDGSYGGLLTKLLFRTLPDEYPAGSALAHFPFSVPEKMYQACKDRKDGSAEKYLWPVQLANGKSIHLSEREKRLPLLENRTWKVVDNAQGVKQVLTSASTNFVSKVDERLEILVEPLLRKKWGDKREGISKAIEQKQPGVTEVVTSEDRWNEYFKKKIEFLLEKKASRHVGSTDIRYVDIVKDVINLLAVHWICEQIAGLPLKSGDHPRGVWYEQSVCDEFEDLSQYVYMNFDPVDDFKLRERAQGTAIRVVEIIKEHLDDVDSHFGTLGDVLEYVKVVKRSENFKFLKELRNSVAWENSHLKLAINVFNATVPTAAVFSKAVAQVVDYYLEEENQQAREQIVQLYSTPGKDSSTKIMEYVREALRLNPIFAGVYRTATAATSIAGSQRIEVGDWVFVDIAGANMQLGDKANYARPAGEQGILLPYEDGMLTPKFFDSVVPGIVGTILSQKNLKRVEGESGKLTQFDELWRGTKRRCYVNTSGLVTPWPDALIVKFEGGTTA